MKILFVNKLFPPDVGGGAELTLRDLAHGIAQHGAAVTVVTTTERDTIVRERVGALDVIRLPLQNIYWHHSSHAQPGWKRMAWHVRDRHNAGMGEALAQVLSQVKPDLISCHNLAGFSAAAWDACVAYGAPTVQVLHDYYHLCPKSQLFDAKGNCDTICTPCGVLRQGRGARSNRLSAVVGVSEAVLDLHLKHGLFSRVPIRRVIRNARDWPPLPARSYPHTATTFGFIGTLAHHKGIELLLNAFRDVAAEPGMPPIRLRVAGGGEASYVEGLRAAHASDSIEFIGRADPIAFNQAIDVAVVPSLWHDPLPGVVFESLLSGTPVIGARRGGIPEMVHDRLNGLLFDPDEPEALKACIRNLATTPGLLGTLAVKAIETARPFGEVKRVIRGHLDLYDDLLGGRPLFAAPPAVERPAQAA